MEFMSVLKFQLRDLLVSDFTLFSWGVAWWCIDSIAQRRVAIFRQEVISVRCIIPAISS